MSTEAAGTGKHRRACGGRSLASVPCLSLGRPHPGVLGLGARAPSAGHVVGSPPRSARLSRVLTAAGPPPSQGRRHRPVPSRCAAPDLGAGLPLGCRGFKILPACSLAASSALSELPSQSSLRCSSAVRAESASFCRGRWPCECVTAARGVPLPRLPSRCSRAGSPRARDGRTRTACRLRAPGRARRFLSERPSPSRRWGAFS